MDKKIHEEREAPIHGDILEAIFSHVPLINLVPARHVSMSWNLAVSTSLRHVNPVKPWLMVHTQSPRAPHVTKTYFYDPRSDAWFQIHAPQTNHLSALRSSHSTLLYMLSPNAFSFSFDSLHLQWHHARAPHVWRTDPIVARVGNCIIVAAGTCEFEDDPLAVEMYDIDSQAWFRCQSMPALLKDSTASTWLSVAIAGDKMHATEKNSGTTYSFDCDSKTWFGPYDLRLDQTVFYCVTGTVCDRLIVIGMVGDAENVKEIKLWEVKGEFGRIGSESEYWCEEMGTMPKEMVTKLKGEDGCGVMASITVTSIGDYVYLHNPLEAEEIIVCEVDVNGRECEWKSVKNMVANDATRMGRMVFCGGDVGLEDLQRAATENCRFVVKEIE